MAKPTVTVEEVKKEVHRKVWEILAQLEWAERYEKAKLQSRYDTLKELWDFMGGDTPEGGE